MKLTDLRGILQYIPRFREKTFIISVDGAIVTDENFANILLRCGVLAACAEHPRGVRPRRAAQIRLYRRNKRFPPPISTAAASPTRPR